MNVLSLTIAVIARPGATLSRMPPLAAKTFGYARTGEEDAPRLARMEAPAGTLIHRPRPSPSSSAIRNGEGEMTTRKARYRKIAMLIEFSIKKP